jgi:tyrosyl-tRNA synthetase
MNAMVTGLQGGKMSSSHAAETKIEFLDDPETVQKKIDRMPCEPGDVQSTVVLLLRDVLLPISQQRVESLQDSGTSWELDGNNKPRPFITEDAPQGTIFSIPAGSWGDSRHYTSFADIQNGFGKGEISPAVLKLAVTNAFNNLLGKIRAIYSESKEWQLVDKLAYPD